MGLEPMIPCLEGKCFIHLSYRGIKRIFIYFLNRLYYIKSSIYPNKEHFKPKFVTKKLSMKSTHVRISAIAILGEILWAIS